ncbi:MAG: LamG domain-containing protein [Planctomycetota bacterium]
MNMKRTVSAMLVLFAASAVAFALDISDPIAHWRFDEGSGDIAFDSAGNNHGTLYGNPTWIAGKVGSHALDFDAVDDYVLVPASPDLPYGSIARTITMWIYTNPSSWRNNETSPFNYGLRSRRQAFGLDMHPHPYMQFYTWEDDLVFNTNAPREGWIHVALMYDGNRIIKAYTQGEFRGSRTLGGLLNTGFSDIEIGTFAHWYFTGKIDDVRIYDRALTPEEIEQLYLEGAADPVAHWKFDEGVGTTACDSADDNDGDIYGAQWTTGVLNGALDFDGFDDYVGLPDNDPVWLPQNDFTLCAWVLFDTTPASSESMILDLNYCHSGSLSNALGCVLCINPVVEKLGFGITTTTSVNEDLLSDYVLLADKWYHLVAVRNGTSQALYIDGQLDASRTCSPAPIKYFGGYDDDRVNIGLESKSYDPRIRYHDGSIDDVRIYDRALSAEEIEQLYEGTFPAIIDVDIKPRSCPNPLNLESKGLLPTAVLGTQDFDVNAVDPASIMLAGVSALRSNYGDVATPVIDGNECECNAEGPDGFVDLTLKFKTPQVVEQIIGSLEDPVAGDELVLVLTGALYDGTLIQGEECIVLVGNVPRALAAKRADIDGDGMINLHDFALLAGYWLEPAETDGF